MTDTDGRILQPLCDACWVGKYGTDKHPTRLKIREYQTCCQCGRITTSGIHVKRHPRDINHRTFWDPTDPEGLMTDD